MSCDLQRGCYFTAAQFTIGESSIHKIARMKLTLQVLDERFAVVRLASGAGLPWWAATSEGLLSVTRTADETSIVCEDRLVPAGVQAERGFAALRVVGNVPFEATGVLASIAAPLAHGGVSIFVISTFDTDYLLVRAASLDSAVRLLRDAQFGVIYQTPPRSGSDSEPE